MDRQWPQPLTISGVINNAPGTSSTGLTLTGGGTVILSNTNTYSGGTTIAAARCNWATASART